MVKSGVRTGFWAKQVRVGALLIVGLVLLLYAVFLVGKIFDVFAERYTIVTLMPSVVGLRAGAPVTLAGQQVGQVDEIEFIPMRLKRNGNHLQVKLKVAVRIKDQIRHDSKVLIRPQGLLGDKYVDIAPGTLASAVLKSGDTIPGEVTLDMEQFLALASEALDTATILISDLRLITGSMARGEGTMGQLLHDERLYNAMVAATGQFERMLSQINSGNGSMGQMIRDPALYQRMVGAMSRVDSLGGSILHGNGTMSLLIRSDSLYRGLAGTANKAESAAAQFSAMLQKMNNPSGSLNKFMTDPRLFDEFLKSVVDLQTLLSDVRQNPKKYVPPINVKVF